MYYRQCFFAVAVVGLVQLLIAVCPCWAQQRKVTEVRIEGLKEIPADSVRGIVQTQPGDVLTEEAIEADRLAIEHMGYFSDVRDETQEAAEGVVVVFHVVENQKVSTIALKGAKAISPDALLKVMGTKPGKVLNSKTIREDGDAILKEYAKLGYAAEITDVDIDKEGNLTLLIQEAVVEKIRIQGLKKTRERVVRREMRVKEGQVFNSRRLQDDLRRIYNLNYFDDVKYDRKPGSEPGKVLVSVDLKEKKTGTAAVGLGFSSRDELVGFVDLAERNFRGGGQQVSVRAEFGDRRTHEFTYAEPWLDKKHTSLSVSVYDRQIYREPRGNFLNPTASDDTLVLFKETRKGARLSLGRPFSRDIAGYVGFRFEDVSLAQLDPLTLVETPLGAESAGLVSSISFSGVRDTRDVVFDATRGDRESLSLELAGQYLGGDSTFQKLDLDLRKYIPVARQFVLAGRLMGGATLGSLPAFEQYFVGGAETVRGYDIDRDYGDNRLVSNLELRYRIQKNLQGVLFADAGDAWGGKFANSQSFDPILGFGLGVRVNTPVGPIRLDYGFGQDGSKAHFSIGQQF